MDRRHFIRSAGLLIAAPAIVHIGSLMTLPHRKLIKVTVDISPYVDRLAAMQAGLIRDLHEAMYNIIYPPSVLPKERLEMLAVMPPLKSITFDVVLA